MINLTNLEAFARYGGLGAEFLTWLLVSALSGELPQTAAEPALKVDLQGPLVFRADGGEAKEVNLSGDEAAAAPEVLAALRQGKRLIRARLIFTAFEDTWKFTWNAETGARTAVKLPVPHIADPDREFEMRMEAHARLSLLLDELFDAFLALRMDPELWKAEAIRWKQFATEGRG